MTEETKLEVSKVSIATPDDVDEVMALALSACEENGFVNPDPVKLLAEIWPALNRDHGMVGIIAGETCIEGAVLLRIGQMWYSQNPVIEEKAIFIHPDYRKAAGGRASRLCEFSKHVSDVLNIPLIIGVLSHNRTKAKIKLYERHFGDPAGAFFLHNAKTGGYGPVTEH
jgi:hypothetical protein